MQANSLLQKLDELENEDEEFVSLEDEADAEITSDIASKLDSLEQEDEEEEAILVEEDTEQASSFASRLDALEEEDGIEQVEPLTTEVPEGFKVVPQVPTGDAPEDYLPKLEPIDVPTPTVSEQTDSAFNYAETARVAEEFSNLGNVIPEDFIEESIAEPFQPIVEWIGKAAGKDIRNLAVAMEAVSDTTANVGVALTKGLKAVGVDVPFEDRVGGEKFAGDMGMMLEMIEAAVPGGSAAMRPVRKLFREAKQTAKLKAKGEKARAKLLDRKMNINKAKEATAEEIATKTARAEQVAAENVDLKNELILGFEEQTGKTISTVVDGVRVVDDELARKAGRETAKKIEFKDRKTSAGDVIASGKDVEVADDDTARLLFNLQGESDSIVAPILKPEKLDGLVAAASDLKTKYPTAFDNDKTVIDNLLDLTINKELIAGDELIDTLNKYNVSFEDYILTVVGSGSEAGKVLNKLSQIKRARPLNEMQDLQRAATQARQGNIRNNIMRLEGIRRGGLVSQLATAARNLQSAGIRSPMDSLGNVMDTALYNMGEAKGVGGKAAAGAKSLISKENWKDSFANMKYMFGPESRLDAKDYVDFILDRPELAKQFDLMFNQLNELQAATGRGIPRQQQVETFLKALKDDKRFYSKNKKGKLVYNAKKARQEAERLASRNFDTVGKGVDTVLSELEDGVSVLNSANRWQEYLVRRGAFLGELERLVKREYKIDLIDTLNDGKIKDLLNDSTTVRPKGARSFNELVADATNNALDVTYAKQPDIGVFREATSFITRNGLTVVMPFPRFMFNSMELMGNYAGGASIPLTKKLMGQIPKGTKLSAKDRQRISRNLVGIGAVGAAYMARTSDDAPADYKEINVGDGTVMDTTPQFPLRQMLYLGEATKRVKDGTFFDFFNAREFFETFLGTNIRTGVGNSIVDEVVQLAGDSDLTRDEAAARRVGRALGNYLSTWAVPFAQIIDSERALGMRGEEYKDVAKDPTLEFGSTFEKEIKRPFDARGFTTSPAEEAALPARERLFQEKSSRVGSALKVGLGLTLRTQDSEEGEYIKRLGLTEFELGSTSKVPSIRRFENAQLRDIIPGIVAAAQAYEESSRDTYKGSPELQDEMTEQEFVNSRIKPLITTQIKAAKKQLSDGKTVMADAPAYIEAMTAYRRLPSDIRKNAASEFLLRQGRPADGASVEDLFALAEYGKALRDAYK